MGDETEVVWREVARSFGERGLIFFGRKRFALDPGIDVDGAAARADIAHLVSPTPGTEGYERITLWLFPSGCDRLPIELMRTRHDPREAVVRCEAWPRGAEGPEDRDIVEARLRWAEDVSTPRLVDRREQRGHMHTRREARTATHGLRERIDAARGALRGRELTWEAPGGERLVLRAGRALLALGETTHQLTDEQRAQLATLCESVEGGGAPSAALVLREPEGLLPGQWRWLPLLAGRRRSLTRAVLRARCVACGDTCEAGALREAAYDQRDDVAGDAGLVLHCPQGHELVRVALP
jgi:hypothetical protein